MYRSILLEMSNVNVLTNHIYGKNFFRKEYKKEDLEGFDMLSMPTEKEYNDFVSILEKLTISNINVAFYKNVGIDVKDDRSLSYMEEFLNNVLPKYKDDILTPLKELRKIRQTPAHKITNNNYDVAYFTKQQLLAKGVYDSIYMLRRLFESHPDVGDQCELSDTSYIEL